MWGGGEKLLGLEFGKEIWLGNRGEVMGRGDSWDEILEEVVDLGKGMGMVSVGI